MKKILFLLLVSFAAAPLLAAASTCQTRVDNNLDKSTAEKVRRCLTEEPEPENDTPVTEVILSDTYSVQYPKQKTKKKNSQPQTIKIYEEQPVSTEFLNRRDYPAFRNDILPSANMETAHDTALEALRGQHKPEKKAKAKKPARKTVKKQVPAPKQQPEPARPQAANPNAPAPEQIRQAQQLQADPLSQNPTQDGSVPEGFLDGGVMGPADFGYNATDPAFQQ